MALINLSWFTSERRVWLVIVGVAAVVGFGTGNGRTTDQAIAHISYQLGDAKAKATCEHKRADKSVAVAKQAIVSANTLAVDPPPESALPGDCKH